MSGIFSKLWPGLALAIILGLGVLLAMKSCHNTVAPDPAGQIMAGIKAGYDSAERVDHAAIAALEEQKDSLQNVLDSLSVREIMMQYKLDILGDTVKQTLAALDQAKVRHDTIPILVDCDSLEAQVKRGVPQVQGFEKLTDSIIRAASAEGAVQDSVIERLTRLNNVADATITAQQLQYEIVHKDDLSKTTQLKIYKPVAFGGVALVVAAILIKLLSH